MLNQSGDPRASQEGKHRLSSILRGRQAFSYFSSTCCHRHPVSREKTRHKLKACLWGTVLAESPSSKSQRRRTVNPEGGSKRVVQFSSAAQSCPTLCDPRHGSMPGLPVHHHLPEFTQTHVHRVSDAIQPPHPLSSPSLPRGWFRSSNLE